MENEYHILGKLFGNPVDEPAGNTLPEPSLEIEAAGIRFLLKPAQFAQAISISLAKSTDKTLTAIAQGITEAQIQAACEALSAKFKNNVILAKGIETYGNANVFNGGSDYEVVSEEWFTCTAENGSITSTKKEDRFPAVLTQNVP
ncbi:MAG: hypothetical protein K6E57_00870 [Fibrobacter sp.]|uniref:hypothetical protein n=1 Tax=Fibrobacter sp. UWP2 TaxID=1896216 RepID=UPI000922CCCF|nr:hypothetical protein [Fibrobacter sp. UWP2]MCR5377510.1 hypothetical protein [Fibrobacter sp.]SHJ37773.1 hypothetical protein SAMN05720471_13311 [Fibrobacter sp. UWP2]